MGKRRQSTSHIEKTNAASRETRQFGIYDQLKVELRKEDPRTLKHPIERSVKSFLETTYLEQEAFGSKSQVATWVLVPSVQTCSTSDGSL